MFHSSDAEIVGIINLTWKENKDIFNKNVFRLTEAGSKSLLICLWMNSLCLSTCKKWPDQYEILTV